MPSISLQLNMQLRHQQQARSHQQNGALMNLFNLLQSQQASQQQTQQPPNPAADLISMLSVLNQRNMNNSSSSSTLVSQVFGQATKSTPSVAAPAPPQASTAYLCSSLDEKIAQALRQANQGMHPNSDAINNLVQSLMLSHSSSRQPQQQPPQQVQQSSDQYSTTSANNGNQFQQLSHPQQSALESLLHFTMPNQFQQAVQQQQQQQQPSPTFHQDSIRELVASAIVAGMYFVLW